MKNLCVFSLLFIYIICINLEDKKVDRLTFLQSYDQDLTNYIFNAEEEFVKHGFFEKDETITRSGKYTYKWANQDKNTYVNLDGFLPERNENGYIDFTVYDSLYINIYSKEKTGSTFIIVLNCQERESNAQSSSKNSYISYYLAMNFKGWKEFKIPLSEFSKKYSPELSKVTGLTFHSSGWSQVPDPTSVIYIDKFFFTKAKYDFNMAENDISEENYSSIIKRLISTLTSDTIDESKAKIPKDRVKALVREAKNNYENMNKEGLPFQYQMTKTGEMTSIYGKLSSIAIGYASDGEELYKDEKVLEALINALDYMNENYYNRREENIFSNDNWWDWEIGTAEYLIEILFCISEELPQKLIDKYLEPINRYDPLPSLTMSNRINVAYSSIFAGVLQKDFKRISISVELIRECFDTVEKLDGFYDDGSFIQHNYISYLGEYGVEMMTALTRISYSLDDSIFRLDEDMKKNQYNWIINSYLPALYNGGFMDLIRGSPYLEI